ncbi:MAG: 50S ribosomal protein L24 [Rickettsiales bacterium]|jgi:large subunit ribosomal protein L24
MSVKFKVKKGDEVIVIAGKEKGKKGKITKLITADSRVVVAGLNMVKRHTKASKTSAGGIIEKEAPLHVSNVSLIDEKSGKPTRVGYKFEEDRKVRFAKRSGDAI